MTRIPRLDLRKGGGAGVAMGLALAMLGACSNERVVQPVNDGVTDRGIPGFEVVSSPQTAQVVWRDGYQFVRIDNADEQPSGATGTSLGLTADQVRKALEAVRFNGGKTPAFADSEIDALAEPLAKALATAKPGQDVVFSIYHSGGLLLFGQRALTAGRMFADNGSLDIIFGEVNTIYNGQLMGNGMPPTIRTGSRQSQTEVDYAVQAGPSVSRADNGRPDWARITPAAWQISAPPRVAAPAAAPAAPAAVAVPPASSGSAAPADLSHDPQDIARRLETLQDLLKRNLITPQDYERRKTEILNRL